jgi:calcineurin-like phosphoesterase family protein
MHPRRFKTVLAAVVLVGISCGATAAQKPAPAPAPQAAQRPTTPPPVPQQEVPVTQVPAKPMPAKTPAPVVANSLKFAIIGDSGTGSSAQNKVAQRLVASRKEFPYEFVLMMGDNLYGGHNPKDFAKKFEQPYKPLLDAGVKFYAALGNHDDPNERYYKQFNMNGERFYSFKPKDDVRIFALDSNYVDKAQLDWLEKQLMASGSAWKIVYFHHPIYSSGDTHGSNLEVRALLEPLFLKHGVDAVFAGHEHFYERIKPQRGIYYFISGGAGKLREGDVSTRSQLTAKSYDSGYHFMLVEVGKEALSFRVVNQDGQIVDSGVLPRVSDQDKKRYAGAAEADADSRRPVATSGK